MTVAAVTLSDWRLPLDEPLYRALNGLGNPALDAVFAGASSNAFGLSCLAVMAALLVLRLRRASWPGLLVGAAVVGFVDRFGQAVLKPLIARMRPCFALKDDGVRLLVEIANSGSMPSLHAANSFAVATTVALLVPRAGWVTYPVATLIAVSRVGVGVHWPSDILAGATFGVGVALGAVALARRFLPLPEGLRSLALFAVRPASAPDAHAPTTPR